MIPTPEYDAALSTRIRTELREMSGPSKESHSELTGLLARLEGEFRHLLAEPDRREKTLAFLRGAPGGPPTPGATSPPVGDPVRRSLEEMATMSSRLDTTTDPSEGFSFAEGVARRAHELARALDGALSALNPSEAISSAFHRLGALLSRLIRNAVAKMREFARLLGVSSFSLAFASDPPCVTATFTFGSG
jgi:hypothetical protein